MARTDANMQDRDRLMKDWRRFHRESRDRDLGKAESFNIFKILNIAHDETKLHTPFLAGLFRSNGTHAQGTLFVREFLSQFTTPDQLPTYVFDRFDDSYICREEEFVHESGRMDIVIERLTGEREKRFCVVVENKIFAGEQQDQLDRYSQYLDRHDVPETRKFLVYLHAREESHRPRSGANVPRDRLKVLRYQDHMARIFRKCLQDNMIKAFNVRDVVAQYLAVIEQIGADMPEMPTGSVFNFWTNPERWVDTKVAARELQQVVPEVRKAFFKTVGERLLTERGNPNLEYWLEKGEIKQVSIAVDGWPRSVRVCLGKYPRWYCGIEGKLNDLNADHVKRMFETSELEHYEKPNDYRYWIRSFNWNPDPDPFEWPQYGREEMQRLAEEVAQLIKEKLLSPFGPKISQLGRR